MKGEIFQSKPYWPKTHIWINLYLFSLAKSMGYFYNPSEILKQHRYPGKSYPIFFKDINIRRHGISHCKRIGTPIEAGLLSANYAPTFTLVLSPICHLKLEEARQAKNCFYLTSRVGTQTCNFQYWLLLNL